MVRFWLASGAIFGFLSVALGAFGAHSLKNVLDDYGKSIYEKAVMYQMFHAMALLAVGLLQHVEPARPGPVHRRQKAIAREAKEDPEVLHAAPHVTYVGRLDEVGAAKFPVLRWEKKP